MEAYHCELNVHTHRVTWETDCENAEVPLQSWVDGEATSSGVHAGHILHIVDLLQSQLVTIIPALRREYHVFRGYKRIAAFCSMHMRH